MSFAGHRFRYAFVNGFPHFMHALLLSMLWLGCFLIWLCELKDLKILNVRQFLVVKKAFFINQGLVERFRWAYRGREKSFPLGFRILHFTNGDILYPFRFVILVYVAGTRQYRQCSPELSV